MTDETEALIRAVEGKPISPEVASLLLALRRAHLACVGQIEKVLRESSDVLTKPNA